MTKHRWSLLPWKGLAACVRVLEHGAAKHGDWTYKSPEVRRSPGNLQDHLESCARHLAAVMVPGDSTDPESKEHHMVHVAVRALMFVDYIEDDYLDGYKPRCLACNKGKND